MALDKKAQFSNEIGQRATPVQQPQMDYLKAPMPAFGDSTQKYTNQPTYQPTFELTQNQAPEGDSRIEDIKSKLERYKRERDELDKIRSKYHSKS